MDFLKMWLGRLIFAAAGVILVVTSVAQHGPKEAAGIVTGIAAFGFAVYSTIRGVTGTTSASGGPPKQAIGLIDVSKWYDFVVLGGLTLVSVIAWAV